MSDFLPPVFKFLTKTDLGKRSNQGGLLVPNPLTFYFLDTADSSDFYLRVSLFRDGESCGDEVTARFHKQDRGGKRSGEYRITGGLADYFRECQPLALILMQKPEDPDGTYRFDLFTQGTGRYKKLRTGIKKAERQGTLEPFRTKEPSGVLPFPWDPEESVSSDAPKAELETLLYQKARQSVYTKMRRLTRDREFRGSVLRAWGERCAVSGDRMKSAEGRTELEAAHIKPKGDGGPDSVNNGICLNRRLHWAFDNGLWSLSQDVHVLVSAKALKIEGNEYLQCFEGQSLELPQNPDEQPKAEYLKWHRENIFLD